jgi:hypothetical protein
MFRRALCLTFVAVVLPIFSSTVPAASPSKASPTTRKAPSKSSPTTRKVPARKRPTATKAARSRTKSKKLPASETVSKQQLAKIFSWAQRQKDIAYRYPTDGCYARAHLLIRRMQKAGYKPYKVWSQANGEPLYVRTGNHPKGYVTWKYHVAPIVRVRLANNEQAWYVIDPSLFTRPVMISTWRDKQRRSGSRYAPFITVTRLGMGPLNPQRRRLPGTGYWLGSDPPGGPDRHALMTMRKYKPNEGKMPPRSFAAGDAPAGPDITSRPTELALAVGPEVFTP